MHQSLKIPLLTCLAVFSYGVAETSLAQVSAEKRGDEAAIRAAAKQYVEAKQRGDVKAASAMWTPTGDYVDATGQVRNAQDLIESQAAGQSPGAASAVLPLPKSSLRFVTPDVAIEDGDSRQILDDGSVAAGRFTAVWTKRDGRWLLDGLRETGSLSPPVNAHLQPLEWLLGERAAAVGDTVMLESTDWSDDGNSIVRKFLVRGPDGDEVSGTQRIGWDPVSEKIKSWTDDSDGGSGEGSWQTAGGRWLVESMEVAADGTKAQISCVYTPGEDGGYIWESKRTKVGGQDVPASRVEFKRAAEVE